MSYEGYEQYLCEDGHYSQVDCWDAEDHSVCHCGKPIVWWNGVDTTNGSFDIDEHGNETELRIDGYVELKEKSPVKTHRCVCGDVHIVAEATYHIPEDAGHKGAPGSGFDYPGCNGET